MRNFFYPFLGIVLLIIPSLLFAQSNKSADSGQLLIPRYGLSAVTDGEWVYVIGGAHIGARSGKDFAISGLVAAYERVNPTTLESEFFVNGLFRRANHSSVLFNGGILTCGGRTQNGLNRQRTSTCEFFSPDSLILREYPALPERLRTLGMVKVRDQVYAIGGLGDGEPDEGFAFSTKTYLLDFKKHIWRHVADMPLCREGAVVTIGDNIYALGGYNGSVLKSVMVFDTKIFQWEQRKELSYGLSAFTAIADGDFIFVFGDYIKRSSIHRYDTRTGNLFLLEKEITPRRHLAAVIVGERVLVFGGNQNSVGKALSTIEAFEIAALRKGGKLID